MKTDDTDREPMINDARMEEGEMPEFSRSNCCYSHDWPYFREPVHPYDYSTDWNLDDEWKARQGGGNNK